MKIENLKMIPILASIQKYHWGKIGTDSFVGRYVQKLLEENKEEIDGTHYAELWLGTHHKSPSMIVVDEETKDFFTEEFYKENHGG